MCSRILLTGAMGLAAALSAHPAAQSGDLVTRAEATGFEETSSYDDVQRFIGRLAAASPLVHVESFGATDEGALVNTFDLDLVARYRADWGFFRDRRPELYDRSCC